MLGLSFTTYLQETLHAVTLGDVLGGVFKSSVYGVIIASAGCLRGFQCGNNSLGGRRRGDRGGGEPESSLSWWHADFRGGV